MTPMLRIHDIPPGRYAALFFLYFALVGGALGEALREPEVKVEVTRGEETSVTTEVLMHVAVPPALAWEVLTDFDRFAEFAPNMTASRIVARNGNVWQVEQKGKARFALLAFSYESLREVELHAPDLIKTRALKGNMKRMETVTRISADGEGTRIHYRNDSVPSFWVPPLIGGAFIRHEVAEQFTAILREMLRRHGARGE